MGNRHRTDEEFLQALFVLTDRLGAPPSIRELADELGLASTSPVQLRLEQLLMSGYVERRPMSRPFDSRLWLLTRKGRRQLTTRT